MNPLLRTLLTVAAAAGGTGLLFLAALDKLIMPAIVQVPMVTVPDLRGGTAEAARERVAGEGLRLALRDSVFSETAPIGHIVEQAPRSGEEIKRARRVFVDVSRGPRLYPVPEVTGGSEREAGLKIQGGQLRRGTVEYASSTTFPSGVVIRQRPAAGEPVERGSTVHLVVSSGSPSAPKRVPDVVGLPIDVVADSLRKYEMTLGTIRRRTVDAAPGRVLSQTPEAGARATRHTAVEVVVSAPPTTNAGEDPR